MKKKLIYITVIAVIGFSLGIAYAKISKKSNLDKHYLDCLRTVKSRMMYGSSVDTNKELADYQDHIELCMHLDGYDGVEIMDMKLQALDEALRQTTNR